MISYFLANDMISIFENAIRNSGIMSGKFLEKTRVPKPGSTLNNPQYYTPADFVIGSTVQSNHTFGSLCLVSLLIYLLFCSNPRHKVASIYFSVTNVSCSSIFDAKFFVICCVSVFSHRFLLIDADLYVLSYLEANADSIPPETLESVRRKLNVDGANDRAWAKIGTGDQS